MFLLDGVSYFFFLLIKWKQIFPNSVLRGWTRIFTHLLLTVSSIIFCNRGGVDCSNIQSAISIHFLRMPFNTNFLTMRWEGKEIGPGKMEEKRRFSILINKAGKKWVLTYLKKKTKKSFEYQLQKTVVHS